MRTGFQEKFRRLGGRLVLGATRSFAGWALLAGVASAAEFKFRVSPSLDKWMYPFEFGMGGSRAVAPTFASFDPRFDTRDAEFLIGWQTQSIVPTNAAPSRYLLRRVRLELTVGRDLVNNATGERVTFLYDPTFDSYRTHLPPTHPDHQADADEGRPVEVFGVGFRGGFDAVTYLEDSPFGVVGAFTSNTISVGTRNAFSAVFDAQGQWRDVANHVGQTNASWTLPPFEARPWAVGRTVGVNPGASVPVGSVFTFDLDLSDPWVAGHLARSLASGRLSLMVSSLSPARQVTPGGTGLGGTGAYPQWSTREDNLFPGPVLEVEGVLIGDADTDADGLPDDWERWVFGDLSATASADSDGDGASNLAEWAAGTDPRIAGDLLRVRAGGNAGRPSLRWSFRPNRTYVVERSADLKDWVPATGEVSYPETGSAEWVAAEEPLAESVNGTPSTGARFLRVRVKAD